MAIYGTAYNSSAGWTGPYQRRLFLANGRYWIFYGEGTGLFWRSSTDGITWSAATALGSAQGTENQHLSVAYDGSAFHYAVATDTTRNILYRKGTANADGTITWAAAEQTILFTPLGITSKRATIAIDSGGYPWIAGAYQTGANVVSSSTKNGTWTTAQNKSLASGGASGYSVFLVALVSSKIYAGSILAVASGASPCSGFLYNGTSWSSEETITSNFLSNSYGQSIAALADVVYLAYPSQDSTGWKCAIRSTAGIWTQTTIDTTNYGTRRHALSTIGSWVYSFYSDTVTDHMFYRRYYGGWGGEVDWLNESVDDLQLAISSIQADTSTALVAFWSLLNDVKVAGIQIPTSTSASEVSMSRESRLQDEIEARRKTILLEFPFGLRAYGSGKAKGNWPPLEIPQPVRRHGN